MNTAVSQAVAAARASLGTPFCHQGRASGIGLDCIGLVIHALRGAGFMVMDTTDYGRAPEHGRLQAALEEHGFEREKEQQAGDVLLFRFQGEPQHAALAVSAQAMIHAYAPIGRVVESGLGESWQRRLVGIYRHPDFATE